MTVRIVSAAAQLNDPPDVTGTAGNSPQPSGQLNERAGRLFPATLLDTDLLQVAGALGHYTAAFRASAQLATEKPTTKRVILRARPWTSSRSTRTVSRRDRMGRAGLSTGIHKAPVGVLSGSDALAALAS